MTLIEGSSFIEAGIGFGKGGGELLHLDAQFVGAGRRSRRALFAATGEVR
ncbi:hypothetical protein [Streptomyces tendae]